MTSGGDPVGGGVRARDDRKGALLLGATEGKVTVQVVQSGDGGWIFGGAQDDTEWASGRGATELENLGHGRRSADVSHGLTGQGRPAELPGGGLPRTSGNEDGNAGTFYATACPGHCGNFEGGKLPPPTVPPMQHAGPLVYTEWTAPCHCTVRQGAGSKEGAVSGGGSEGEHKEGL